MTTTRKIIIFTCISLPVFLIALYSYFQFRENTRERIYAERRNLASLSARVLHEKLDRVYDVGISLSSRQAFSRHVDEQHWDDAIAILQKVPKDFPFIERVLLTDTRGTLMGDAPPSPALKGKSYAERDWYKGIRKNWQPYLSEVYKRIDPPHTIVTALALPIKNTNGKIRGILVLQVDVAELLEWSKEISIGSSGFVYVVDHKGHIAANPQYTEIDSVIDYSSVPAVQKALSGKKNVEVLYNPIVKENRLTAYEQVPEYGWAVIVQQEASAALAGVNSIPILFLNIGVVLFAFGAAYYITREMDRRNKAEGELIKSNELFSNLFNHNPASVAVSKLSDGKMLKVNDAFLQLSGFEKREEVIGKSAVELNIIAHPEDRAEIARLLNEHKTVKDYEVTVQTKQGKQKHVATSVLLLEVDNEPCLFSVSIDITERKKAEAALLQSKDALEELVQERTIKLSESEEKYRSIFESFYDIYYQTDLEGNIKLVSPSILARAAYTPEELIGRPVTDVYANPSDREPFIQLLMKQGFVRDYELDLKAKDGRIFTVSATTHFIIGENGTPIGIEGILHDITERKKAEEQIKQQAMLIDIINDAIILLDRQYNILSWNKGAERMYGYTSEEAMGKNIIELLKIKSVIEPTISDTVNLYEKDGEIKTELLMTTKDGRELHVDGRGTAIKEKSGGLKSTLAIYRDVTEHKKLEKQYLRSQRMESVGTLAGGIAHDLNNVLAPILLSVEMFQKKFTDQQSQKYLKVIETSAQRGANLIKQILSFARGTEGERSVMQTRHIITEIQKVLQETFVKSIDIITNVPKDLWVINADANQIHQVLMNLCVNARDAMPSGGTLTITAENLILDEFYARMNIDAKVGPYITISVADTGTGMPPDVQEKIFEPFFTTKEIGKGTGLGLATVFSIVKSHGGFVHVYSEVGKGTTFKMYFPASQTAETQQAEMQVETFHRGNRELILVIDDEPSIREITKATLEAHNFRAITANDGAEGVATFLQYKNEIKCVITDMNMPVMDGVATVRAIRSIESNAIIIGASGSPKKTKQLEETNDLQATLQKPYTAEKLLKTVAKVLKG